MRRNVVLWLLAVLTISQATLASPGPATFALEMDQDPQNMGWTVSQGGGGSHVVHDGLLGMSSETFYEFHAPSAVLQALSNAEGWAVDTRFRFTGGSNDMTIWVHDNTTLNVVRIGHNSIHVYAGAIGGDLVFPYVIDANYHTYRLEAIGQRIRMLVDGNVAFDIEHLAPGGGTRTIYFGDGSFSFPTFSQWDYFRISTPVPEPASFLGTLFAAGFLLARPARARADRAWRALNGTGPAL